MTENSGDKMMNDLNEKKNIRSDEKSDLDDSSDLKELYPNLDAKWRRALNIFIKYIWS
ncbi:MAG: hypothetical protein GF364_04575 [Candidatus Lokiarchaeota archaeon]|nr:hypothetical protein [Candidatus Lokiarchaeota archaeon]